MGGVALRRQFLRDRRRSIDLDVNFNYEAILWEFKLDIIFQEENLLQRV